MAISRCSPVFCGPSHPGRFQHSDLCPAVQTLSCLGSCKALHHLNCAGPAPTPKWQPTDIAFHRQHSHALASTCPVPRPLAGMKLPRRTWEQWWANHCRTRRSVSPVAVAIANEPVEVASGIGPEDVYSVPDEVVAFGVRQPAYEVRIVYRDKGRPLEGARMVFAHVGHSGWQDTADAQLKRAESDPQVWWGIYLVPLARLANPSHLEVQLVFKGVTNNEERWDNNMGRNWSLAVEASPGEGLVAAPDLTHSGGVRALASSLLLRLDALIHKELLSPEQAAMLRSLAWHRDFVTLKLYERVRGLNNTDLVGALIKRCGVLGRPGLHVVHVASEMAPVAKVGGLADVVTSLAKAHQLTGTLAEIILPKYDCMSYSHLSELSELVELEVMWRKQPVKTKVFAGLVEGLPVYFIEPRNSEKFFWRGRFYGEPDDAERFLFFSRAALEFLLQSGKQPDVLHIHDWQCAAVAPLLKEEFRKRGLTRPAVVLTIHNIAFQGWLSPDYIELMGLDKTTVYTPEKLLDNSRPGFVKGQFDINLLKGGVVYADRVTTVSPTYAREVFDPAYGMGMQGPLSQHASKFRGVLNGIDYEMWNPATDALLPAHYTASGLEGKELCKCLLLEQLNLPYSGPAKPGDTTAVSRPLVSVVSRLTEQKGLPLIMAMMEAAMKRGAQVVVLGTAPDPVVQAKFEKMAADFSRGGDARLVLRFDDALSHCIYAGADIILVPSFFEPCGLTQLISLRYGTIPVVRETGGLADTVRDVARSMAPEHERNGFTFKGKTESEAVEAVERAINAYRDGHDWWKTQLVPRAMQQDWSWSRSAQEYLEIYHQI